MDECTIHLSFDGETLLWNAVAIFGMDYGIGRNEPGPLSAVRCALIGIDVLEVHRPELIGSAGRGTFAVPPDTSVTTHAPVWLGTKLADVKRDYAVEAFQVLGHIWARGRDVLAEDLRQELEILMSEVMEKVYSAEPEPAPDPDGVAEPHHPGSDGQPPPDSYRQ